MEVLAKESSTEGDDDYIEQGGGKRKVVPEEGGTCVAIRPSTVRPAQCRAPMSGLPGSSYAWKPTSP